MANWLGIELRSEGTNLDRTNTHSLQIACLEAVDVVIPKHVSDAVLEKLGIGLGRVTKRRVGERNVLFPPGSSILSPGPDLAQPLRSTACEQAKSLNNGEKALPLSFLLKMVNNNNNNNNYNYNETRNISNRDRRFGACWVIIKVT